MKPHQANILNATVLILMGLWAYFGAESPSPTALIPVGFGLLFLLATGPFKNENKVVAHIIVLLTLLLIVMLYISPFRRALSEGNQMAMIRVVIMMAVGLVALIIYIKSFVDARKARKAEES